MASEESKPQEPNKRPLEDVDAPQSKERKLDTPAENADPNLNAMLFGLPSFMDQKKFNKFLAANSVVCKKAKKTVQTSYAFMYFENMEQKEEATRKLKGIEIKGIKLCMEDMKGKNRNQPRQRQENKAPPSQPTGPLNVNQATAPLWEVPYSEQLQQKAEYAKGIITKIVQQIKTDNKNRNSYLHWTAKNEFPFEGVRPVPITNKYRNKVQFTIDRDKDGKPCVGFVAGKFLEGSQVMSPEGAVTMPDRALHVRNAIQEFIDASPLPPYNQSNHSGFWRLLTVKAFTRTNEVMAIVQASTVGTDAKDYEQEKARLVAFIEDKHKSGLEINSLMIQEYSGVASDSPISIPCLHLWGATHVHEKLLDQTFRISPHAFFQINTMGAEILYKIVLKWCSASPDSTVLDLCCGTGTIGQCIAKNVKEVLGIELSADAVADAKLNAELNGHKNTRYIAGKVEDVLANTFSTLSSTGPIIAVVDPPRAGLHNTVLHAIRGHRAITRLVYVSCEPHSLISNSSLLCRPESNRLKGLPFRPVNSVAVDMFPHTKKLEMVVLFEREDAKVPEVPTVTKLDEPKEEVKQEVGQEVNEEAKQEEEVKEEVMEDVKQEVKVQQEVKEEGNA